MRMVKPKANTGIAKTKAASRKQRRDADKKDVSMSTKKRQTTKKISEAVASIPKSRRGILVATYKKRPDQMGWIVKHKLYNYALSAEEATATKKDDWNKVKEFWLYSGPKDKRHIYEAEFVGVKPRKEFLAEYPDYPKGKTKHGDFYALFKVAIRYQPTTVNFKAVVRAPDFNRTPKVAKAVRAYQAGGELGCLLDCLPVELAPSTHDQLRVCEAVQFDFMQMMFPERRFPEMCPLSYADGCIEVTDKVHSQPPQVFKMGEFFCGPGGLACGALSAKIECDGEAAAG